MCGFVCPATGGKKHPIPSRCGSSSGTCDRFALSTTVGRPAHPTPHPPTRNECGGIKEAEIKSDTEKEEARDGGSRETQGKKEREPDRQPEGHLKVNGMLLAPLVTHVRSPAPLAFIPLARSLARSQRRAAGW